MKNYMSGSLISLITFIILALIDWQVYNHVMSFGVLMPLLVVQVAFYNHLIIHKKRITYFIFVFIFIVSTFFSLPELTHHQAKEKVQKKYEVNIVETGNVLTQDSWNPFASNRAYFFKGENSKLEEISIIVSANTGKTFVID